MQEVYDFLKKCGAYYLATVDGEQPHVRPFGTIDCFEGKLYIQTGRTKDVAKQIAKNPKAELCAFDGSSWMRVTATLVDDNRLAPKAHMLDSYPDLKQMYAADDPNTVVYYLKDVTANLYGPDESKTTFHF